MEALCINIIEETFLLDSGKINQVSIAVCAYWTILNINLFMKAVQSSVIWA